MPWSVKYNHSLGIIEVELSFKTSNRAQRRGRSLLDFYEMYLSMRRVGEVIG